VKLTAYSSKAFIPSGGAVILELFSGGKLVVGPILPHPRLAAKNPFAWQIPNPGKVLKDKDLYVPAWSRSMVADRPKITLAAHAAAIGGM
jgi:hypothetical protein